MHHYISESKIDIYSAREIQFQGGVKMIHKNYAEFEENNPEMKEHVDQMYKLINNYAKENGIKLAYDDRAEVLVEAIATYIVNSQKE